MNSIMVKPEKFGHIHLVYHFTIPLNPNQGISKYIANKVQTTCFYLINKAFLKNKNMSASLPASFSA